MVRLGFVVALGALVAACGTAEPSPLSNTHGSASALAESVLKGFERRDIQSLGALALTEREFREHVWPELPASRPERNLPFSYVWGDLRQKSEASLAESIARYGGRALAVVRVEYEGETTRYATFLVHRDTMLTVRDSAGTQHRLRVYGSTLEKNGVFKIFSYVADD